ncbi:hypothetical protein [Pseudactinotalea sp. HY160]|nr:hypothetical protein [Pseudactinotalea sp. HY160]
MTAAQTKRMRAATALVPTLIFGAAGVLAAGDCPGGWTGACGLP